MAKKLFQVHYFNN